MVASSAGGRSFGSVQASTRARRAIASIVPRAKARVEHAAVEAVGPEDRRQEERQLLGRRALDARVVLDERLALVAPHPREVVGVGRPAEGRHLLREPDDVQARAAREAARREPRRAEDGLVRREALESLELGQGHATSVPAAAAVRGTFHRGPVAQR